MPLTGKPQWRHHLEAVHPLHRSPQRILRERQLRQKPDLTSYLDGGELLRHLSARFGGGPLLRPEEPHPSTTAASPNLDNDWEVHLLEEAEQWENWSSVWTPASGRGHGWSSTPSRGRTVTGTVPRPPPPPTPHYFRCCRLPVSAGMRLRKSSRCDLWAAREEKAMATWVRSQVSYKLICLPTPPEPIGAYSGVSPMEHNRIYTQVNNPGM